MNLVFYYNTPIFFIETYEFREEIQEEINKFHIIEITKFKERI